MMELKSVMEYKLSFVLLLIGQFLTTFGVVLGTYFLFQRFHAIRGYTMEEVMLCYSMILIQFTVAECLGRGFDYFPALIRSGNFDRILLRPQSTLLQVMGSKFEFTRIGRLGLAVVMFVYGFKGCEIAADWVNVLTIGFMMIGGVCLFIGIFVFTAGISFFTIDGLEIVNILTNGALEFAKYPIAVYGKAFLRFCTFVIPYALVQYYPLMLLLGREGAWWWRLLPLAACLFIVPCVWFWRFGMRHYQSCGS